ncbi:hypothetical protein F5144DRAFT_108962 [Chaetomium tenue]|uniref:Uncharacterized protein n=1 Tax=Chaetomium tenue TaxID=1854479 RepID=A0ACB7PI61_9PEZI|nr:hypothetical protein F5144DRAFT_108962 [Chaetomium globosum]
MSASSSGRPVSSRKEKQRRIMRWLASWQKSLADQTNPPSKNQDNDDDNNDQLENGAVDSSDTRSIRSQRSNHSAQSAKSRGSISSFRSFASHFSRLSRMSGSSQRSYENPVLESVQTIVDLATKLEADNKRTMQGRTSRASMAREARKRCDCYEESLKRLRGQVEGYAAHPAVVYSGVHTSPKELVLLCDRVRQVDHGPRAEVDTEILTLHSDLLDEVATELASWFNRFVTAPSQQEPIHRVYIPSPLKNEVPLEESTGDGVCPFLKGQDSLVPPVKL